MAGAILDKVRSTKENRISLGDLGERLPVFELDMRSCIFLWHAALQDRSLQEDDYCGPARTCTFLLAMQLSTLTLR